MPRTVFMNSDLIKDKNTDLKFLQSIGKTLDYYNVPYHAFSYESSPHVKLLGKTNGDSIFCHTSLMCAGTIVDVSSSWYQKLKGNRKFLWNYYTQTEDYAFNVSRLKRADDDNFSPKSFTGLDNPVQYQVSRGKFHVSSTTDPRKVGRVLAMLAYSP
jgi:hypothetical protein